MLNQIESIFEDMHSMLGRLKKSTYEANFNNFENKNLSFFEEVLNMVGMAEDKDTIALKISEDFIASVFEIFKNNKNKIPKVVQADINLFMVYYVLPLILKINSDDNKFFADKLCTQWKSKFKDSKISYVTYEEIYGSFNEKILGAL